MLVKQFDYNLPSELISQKPIKPRDQARLLILDRTNNSLTHKHFFDIVDYFQAGDVLVLNNSKVIPARLLGKKETGGAIEIFLLNEISPCLRGNGRQAEGVGVTWFVLIKGKIKTKQKVFFPKGIVAEILTQNEHFSPPFQGGARGGLPNDSDNQITWEVKFNCNSKKLFSIGHTPLPPYIKGKSRADDYQTIFAKPEGSVAAPTAGLHFTKRLLNQLLKKGIHIEYITLHVGLGTFAPVKTNKIEDHKIHSELAIISKQTAQAINRAKQSGRRIIACGTTSVRTLEAFTGTDQKITPGEKWVNIFIYPGYLFKLIDAMITNFHLPKSTLLMLISAFAGTTSIKKAYQEAIRAKYKFYSFGDAMLII